MRNVYTRRLRALEERRFLTQKEAGEIVKLLTEAMTASPTPQPTQDILSKEYARSAAALFRQAPWVSQRTTEAWIDHLIGVTLAHCNLDQRRHIRESLNTLQQQGEYA